MGSAMKWVKMVDREPTIEDTDRNCCVLIRWKYSIHGLYAVGVYQLATHSLLKCIYFVDTVSGAILEPYSKGWDQLKHSEWLEGGLEDFNEAFAVS